MEATQRTTEDQEVVRPLVSADIMLVLTRTSYNRQNALIDAYLGSTDEESLEIEDNLKNGGKVKFAVNASFVCNLFLFIIQTYGAISTGSLALFATAADAFVGFMSN